MNNLAYGSIGTITEDDLREGARAFELFSLLPKTMDGKTAWIKMKINKKWGGWRLKDELVEAMGLEIGNTINTEITVLEGPGLCRDEDDVDLFASGDVAQWLLMNDVGQGSEIEGKVKFVYTSSPVGRNDKVIWTIKLILLDACRIIKEREYKKEETEASSIEKLIKLLGE